jgi:hypothetical protein
MKRIHLIYVFVLFLFTLTLSNCIYYKTLELSTNEPEVLNLLNDYKNTVFIEDTLRPGMYSINNFTVDDTSIYGTLTKSFRLHPPHDNAFKKKSRTQISFNIDPLRVMHIYVNSDSLMEGPYRISNSSIQSVEIHEKAVGRTFIASISIPILIVGIPAAIFAAACNCPYVESYNDSISQFQGTLFPGAIFKSLQRADYIPLDNKIRLADGGMKIKVYNNLPEIQYIDELSLYECEENSFEYVSVESDNKVLGFNLDRRPISALAGAANKSVLELMNFDSVSYSFDNLDQENELNSLTVSFDRNKLSDHSKLIVVAKETQWLENVASFLFYNIGNRHEEWLAKKDEKSPKKWNERTEENGITLRVSIKEKGKWKYISSFKNAGTMNMRKLIMDVDLSRAGDSIVDFKFECAYQLWEIDYIGLTDDYQEGLSLNKIAISEYTNQLGEDVSEHLLKTDGDYYIQEQIGTYVNLSIPHLNENASLFLMGSGYYHHIIDNDADPNYTVLRSLKKDLSFHRLSKQLDLLQKTFADKEE